MSSFDPPTPMKIGFPRPWNAEFKVPVPYTAEDNETVSVASMNRVSRCIERGLCTICGTKLDDTMFVAVFGPVNNPYGSLTDPGFAHDKCGTMTEKFCPHFKYGRAGMIKVYTKPVLKAFRAKQREVFASASKTKTDLYETIMHNQVDMESGD